MNVISSLIITLLLCLFSESKLYKQQFTFSNLRRNKGWIFLDRMKLGKGYAEVRLKTKIILKEGQATKSYSLELGIVPDNLWAQQSLLKCSREAKSYSDGLAAQQSTLITTLQPNNNYDFGAFTTISIKQTQMYHFVLRDCQKNLLNQYFSRESRLIVELEIKNNGKGYGQDQSSNFFWFPLLIVGTIVMIKYINLQSIDNSQGKQTDYVKILVLICIWLNLFSLVFKYIGYLIYYFLGSDYNFFDFMYLLFHSIGDAVIVSILLFVSFGWTITFISGKDFDLYVPLVCMMGLITIILTLLNKITDGSHDKFHMYDTIPAYLLVFFKSVTIIIFIVGCVKTYIQTKKQPQIRRFMIQILILGGFYLASIPLVMIIVQYIPASQRKQWVFILIELIKNFICFLLTYMISYKKSGYKSISFGEKSFMQSGGRLL